MLRKYLYLPIETKSREFDAKVLLAYAAANAGWDVIIGREDVLNELVNHFPRGIYLAKNINQDKERFIHSIYKKGFNIFFSDEESGLTQNDFFTFLDQRISLKNLQKICFTFLWSEQQAKIFGEKYCRLNLEFSNAGSPRLDLMTKEFNSLEDRGSNYYGDKYGTYILLSSNFTVNNLYGTEEFKNKLLRAAKNKRQIIEFLEWYEYKKKTFSLYLEFIKEMSVLYPDVNIVIRPHPGENPNSWDDLVDIENVFVDKKFSLISAIKNSRFVIHHGCTASLEASLQGVPSIYYDPIKEEGHVSNFCKDLSFYLTERKEVYQNINVFLNQSNVYTKDGVEKIGIKSDGLSYLRFIRSFDQCAEREGLSYEANINVKRILWKAFFLSPIPFFKGFLRNYLPSLHPVGRIIKEKCPTIKSGEIQELGFNTALKMSADSISCRKLTKNLFHISIRSNDE